MKDEIAIIGMYGKMPHSDSPEQFWEHLMAGDDLISEIPADRFLWQNYYGDPLRERHKTNSKWGGFLDDIWGFDSSLFKIIKTEADGMDPQQKIMLEIVFRLFEDAGYRPSDYAGSPTGVFVGVSNVDFLEYLRSVPGGDGDICQNPGNNHSMVSGRISYTFDLKGPCESVDTLCSSSHTAICNAVNAIRSGRCSQAVAGGVHIILSPSLYLAYAGSRMQSPDGRCKTFDKTANGFVRGEGAGALLLKPLEQARKDKDRIYGVIKGAAVRHQGRGKSIVSPVMQEQAGVIADAVDEAEVLPEDISYIETHGSGTALGDVVEINGLKEAFTRLTKGKIPCGDKRCGLGAVKTNIGHLESAAGIAGVIKVLLAMKYGRIPQNLHCCNVNPILNLENGPFYLLNKPKIWEADKKVAGISSFGAGGVNSHIVIENYKNVFDRALQEETMIFILSADTKELLLQSAEKMVSYLQKTKDPMENIIYTLQIAREERAYRIACITTSVQDLIKQLEHFLSGKISSIYYSSLLEKSRAAKAEQKWNPGEGKLFEIMETFLSGGRVDWEGIYRGRRYSRVEIPGSLMNKTVCQTVGGG